MAAVAAVTVVAATAGFADQPTSSVPPSSEPWTWDVDEAVTISELAPPYPATMNVVWPAREVLIQVCMAERGYDYEPLPSIDYDAAWKASLDWSLLLPENAAVHGYHLPLVTDPPEVADAMRELEALTASDSDYRLAFSAKPGEADELGCVLVASEILDDGLVEENAALNAVASPAETQVAAAVEADPDYRLALDAWVTCMDSQGYGYTHPDQPWNDSTWVNAPEPTDDEVATAVNDSACRMESGYNDAMRAAQRTAVAAWVADHADLIARFQRADAELRQRAQTVLDDR